MSRSQGSSEFNPHEQTLKATIQSARMITQRQKQALIDNLQLEVTERARKLRAQYALQAQSLHTRIELRVNRIPTSLRSMTLGELLDKHSKAAELERKTAIAHLSPNLDADQTHTHNTIKVQKTNTAVAIMVHGTKRLSDHFENDKENTPDLSHAVNNPKKRTKPNQDRRHPDPSTVLSPKSSNSRNVRQSSHNGQIRSQKIDPLMRSESPLKSASPVKTVMMAASERPRVTTKATVNSGSARSRPAAKSSAAATEPRSYAKGRVKRGLALTGDRAVSSASSNTSGISGTSASTTIVKKVGRALGASTTTAVKKNAANGTVRRDTAATTSRKTAPTGASAAGRRILRKRA